MVMFTFMSCYSPADVYCVLNFHLDFCFTSNYFAKTSVSLSNNSAIHQLIHNFILVLPTSNHATGLHHFQAIARRLK